VSWFDKPVNVVITVVAILMFVGGLIGVVYGVRTHREEGLLQVCWVDDDRGGRAVRYFDTNKLESGRPIGGPCENPEELVWPRKQIPITVTANGDSPRFPSVVKQAVSDINRQLGFVLFVVEREGGFVVIESAPIEQGRPLGYTQHYWAFGSLGALVGVSSAAGSERMVYLITRHELLHVVGLGHDQYNPSSCMHPLTADDTNEQRMGAARITDFDNRLLNERYNPAATR
jgi:hypothetical protein